MFVFRSIPDYHTALMNGTTTCVDAVRSYITNIKAAPHLNAFIEVFEEEALERAALLDQRPVSGKLYGVIIGIKDNICYKDHQVTAASAMLKGFTSLYSATAVEKLLAEGAIIIGRQNCDEFAMGSTNETSAYGPSLNARDHTKVPGGSSGGSAVAVQAKLCMVSIGSDSGGSVRQPADHCGIVGFKPSYGAVSRHGLISYASSFDVIGVLANSVEDAQLIFKVIQGADDHDPTSFSLPKKTALPNRPRIAYFKRSIENEGLDAVIKAQFLDLVEKLTEYGIVIEAIEDQLFDQLIPAYYILTTAEASSNLGRYDGIRFGLSSTGGTDDLSAYYTQARSAGFGKEVKRRIMLGSFVLSAGYYDAYFTQAQKVRALLNEHNKKIFGQYDLLISPTVPATAQLIGKSRLDPIKMYLADIYTVYANLVGIPAISLPLFKHDNGMPFGLQVMAPVGNDLPLLGFTRTIEEGYKQQDSF